MILCTGCFASMNILVKSLHTIPTFQIVFFRAIGTASICALLLVQQGQSLLGTHRELLMLRGVTGAFSLLCFFHAIKLMPLGSAVSLRYLAPFIAIVLSVFFLKEKVRGYQWFFVLLAFTGALLIKGFDSRISFEALFWILSSALLVGVVYFLLRKIGNREHPLVIILYFTTISTFISFPGAILYWVNPDSLMCWFQLIGLGLLGFGGQYFMTKAFQIEETSRVAPLKYLEAIFAITFAWILFDENHDWVPLLGMALILVGVMGNSLIKKTK